MKETIKQLALICLLIVAASALLLSSDKGQRRGHEQVRHKSYPSIAVFQIASTYLIDAHVSGIVEQLANKGYLAPNQSNLKMFNAQGDTGVANAIAQEMANSSYDIVITSSTVALQTFANANDSTQITHVFGAVTNPYSAGVGITGPEPDQHPPHLIGLGTFQPVKGAFEIARQMNPKLSRVGVVWNPAEQSSESCLIEARQAVSKNQMTLVEAVATNTSEVYEATQSLIAKDVDAIWVGGDVVATASVQLIIKLATEAKIPVFTNDPTDADKGALFGLGADYKTVGQLTADMAIAVLEGRSASEFRIENVVPESLAVNNKALDALADNWRLTAPLKQRLVAQKEQAKSAVNLVEALKRDDGKKWKVALTYIVPAPVFEMATKGLLDGLAELGLVEGENLEIFLSHANGDFSFLPQVTSALASKQPDVFVAMSTPSLASAIAHAKDLNIVFGIVSAPLEAGAGNSFEDHLPNVTGIVQLTPTDEVFKWIKKVLPKAKRMGVVYNPSEANSVKAVKDLLRLTKEHGMTLVEVNANTTSEVPEAILGLLAKQVDVVYASSDNTVVNGMPAIINATRQHRIPVIADDISLMGTGALLSCAPGLYSDGKSLATVVARVLAGESPEFIPIRPSDKNELVLDMSAFKAAGIVPSVELLEQADVILNFRQDGVAPAHIALVNLIDNPLLTSAIDGVKQGLTDLGLKEGKDFRFSMYSAQGDVALLPQLFDRALMDKPDLLMTVTTPAMIAAVNRKMEVPHVFTVASDPVAIGLYPEGKRPKNLAGVHDDPALGELLAMARKWDDSFRSVGIIYDASEANARLSAERLRQAGKEQNVPVLEITASSPSDLTMATQTLIQQGVSAIILGPDNLVTTGFPAIYQETRRSGIPIYTVSAELMKQGAAGVIGDNYFEWGRHSGVQAAKVLIGVPPSRLPILPLPTKVRIEPKAKANAKPAHKKETVATWLGTKKVRLVLYSETEFAERSREAYLVGLAKAGLVPGGRMDYKEFNAQGDMTTLSSIMQTVAADHPDLVLVVSTHTLQAALRQVARTNPVVFTGVGDAIQAGAGESETNHHPNVTGITTRSPFVEMAKLIKETLPAVRNVGTLFTPAEINSVLYKDWLNDALASEGLKLVAIPVTSSSEITQATAEMVRHDIQLVAQVVDNLTRPGFALIARQADESNLPVFVFDSNQMNEGGTLALARDYYDAALEASDMAVSILKGASPANIPIRNASHTNFILNEDKAKRFGLRLGGKLMTQYLSPSHSDREN